MERTARRLGADAFWAASAAACIGCAPLVLQVQTGFLSDGTYLGLLALAAWAGVRWLQEGRGLGVFIALALLGATQRQVGLLVLGALFVVSIFGSRRSRTPLLALAAAGIAGSLLIVFLQQVVGVNSGKLGVLIGQTLNRSPLITGLGILLAGVPIVGLLSFPLVGGLMFGRRPRAPAAWPEMILPGLGLFGLLAAVGLAIKLQSDVFPGDTIGIWGLGSIERMNIAGKVSPFRPPVFFLIQAFAVAGGAAVFVWRVRDWLRGDDVKAAAFLVLAGAGQALPMFVVGVGDRYLIPAAVVLLPVAAALARKSLRAHTSGLSAETLARWFALAAFSAGLLTYVVGETDYVAWHVARDSAAGLARNGIDPTRVDGGDEDFATHILIPYYDKYGTYPPYVTPDGQALRTPDRIVEFAPVNASAPGFTYGGSAPGKVIVRCLNPPSACPLSAPR